MTNRQTMPHMEPTAHPRGTGTAMSGGIMFGVTMTGGIATGG